MADNTSTDEQEAIKKAKAQGVLTGAIKSVKSEGFGWITGDDAKDRFFHKSAVQGEVDFDDMRQHMRVRFIHIDTPKGPRALQVEVIGK